MNQTTVNQPLLQIFLITDWFSKVKTIKIKKHKKRDGLTPVTFNIPGSPHILKKKDNFLLKISRPKPLTSHNFTGDFLVSNIEFDYNKKRKSSNQQSFQKQATTPLYLDVHFPENKDLTFEQFITHQNNAFLYVYEGEVSINGSSKNLIVHSKEMAILTNEGDFVLMNSNKLTKLILISGAPLRESIVQYGPFVMNTKEQIIKAVEDFRSGQLA